MPRLPQPLAVRDWAQVARQYCDHALDPQAKGRDFPVVRVEPQHPGFRIKTYLGGGYDGEAFSALGAVISAKLSGLDPRHLHGTDYVARCKAWYDPGLGVYRHRIGDRSSVLNADIYGYWPAIQGMMLAAQYPDDGELQQQALATVNAFERIAQGLGGTTRPDYDVLGWNFATSQPAGRPEPMNRLGNAPSVAWVLMVGASLKGNAGLLALSRAAMGWYIAHPGRYEMSHAMGPLTVAQLNVQCGPSDTPLDIGRVLAAWFGEGTSERCPWRITAGTHFNGLTCDGLDGARWDNDGFYAFTLGTLQNPAWLVPVVRYDTRYARDIARYALHAANSARLLQGQDLDADHQDHAAWKARWDKEGLLFYEGLASEGPGSAHTLQPYARGDAVLNGWGTRHPPVPNDQYLEQRRQWFGATSHNIALYMGNSVGFLGGILRLTNVPGVLCWDCTKTDWFHPPAYPTHLLYNPYERARKIHYEVAAPCDLYDAVQHHFVARDVRKTAQLALAEN